MARVNYFQNVETLEDVRIRLIERIRELDPKSKKFETMVDQYQRACVKYCDKHKSRKGKIYETKARAFISPTEFAKLAGRIAKMEGVNVYCDGGWLWFNGNTKEHRKELTEIKREIAGKGILKYSEKRQEWWYEDKTA